MSALSSAVVASPCIGLCRMDPASGLCEGCARTLDEIAQWSQFDDAAKRLVLERLSARRAAMAIVGGGFAQDAAP